MSRLIPPRTRAVCPRVAHGESSGGRRHRSVPCVPFHWICVSGWWRRWTRAWSRNARSPSGSPSACRSFLGFCGGGRPGRWNPRLTAAGRRRGSLEVGPTGRRTQRRHVGGASRSRRLLVQPADQAVATVLRRRDGGDHGDDEGVCPLAAVIAALSTEGVVAPLVLPGSVDAAAFDSYVE